MTSVTATRFSALFCLVFICVFITPGWSAAEQRNRADRFRKDFCEQYARTAGQQNKENLRKRCGYSGPKWNSDSDRHYSWCMNNDNSSAEAENRARDLDLRKCSEAYQPPSRPPTGVGNKREFCEKYARNAVRQNRQNLRWRCGQSGARWSYDFESHYDWCVKDGRDSAEEETAARREILQRCRGSFQDFSGISGENQWARDFCEQYARTGVEQNEENIKRGCGLSGPRWRSDYGSHFSWCLKNGSADADAETNAREEELGSCMDNSGRRY